jgi:hypothetical protein
LEFEIYGMNQLSKDSSKNFAISIDRLLVLKVKKKLLIEITRENKTDSNPFKG